MTLREVRDVAKRWVEHFDDWIETAKKFPPTNTQQVVTAMWTIAHDARDAFAALVEDIEDKEAK